MGSFAERVTGQPSKGLRRGHVFSVRITDEQHDRLAELHRADAKGPRALGPWLVWRALGKPVRKPDNPRGGSTRARVLPWYAETLPLPLAEVGARIVLDLCAGSGAWSAPYVAAGYHVIKVTLPDHDVRTYVPPPNVWGVLAAPPCTEMSLAKNGQARNFVVGMECVNACMRIVQQAKPTWWALENPTGYLSKFLGTPRDVFQPFEFGDAWTKQTALWGDFATPMRGPYVKPTGSAMDRATPAARAVTPPGFARAFFEANP